MFKYTTQQATFYSLLIAVLFSVCIILAMILKGKSEKIRRIPIVVVGAIIIFLEVIKQIYNALGYDTMHVLAIFTNTRDEFSYYSLPFHFCSLFSLLVILSLFSRGKARKIFESIAYVCSAIIALTMFFLPDPVWGSTINSLINGEIDYLSHTVIYHLMVLSYFSIETALCIAKYDEKNWWHGLLIFPFYSAIGIPAARIFNENYCSFLEPIGDGNVFGPVTKLGPFWYSVLFVFLGTIVCGVFYVLVMLFRKSYKYFDEQTAKVGFLIFASCNVLIFVISLFTNIISKIFIPLELIGVLTTLLISFIIKKKRI